MLNLDTIDTDTIHRSTPGSNPYTGWHRTTDGRAFEIYSFRGYYYAAFEDSDVCEGPYDSAKEAYRDTLQRE